jgi:putative endonuclease
MTNKKDRSRFPSGNDKQRGKGKGDSRVCHSRRESAFAFIIALRIVALFRLSFPKGIRFRLCRCAAMLLPMQHEYNFWVYILSSRSRNLYIGVTNNLRFRHSIHLECRPGTYTAKYHIHRLVYYEHFQYVLNAIAREKLLKHWTRAQKIALIESINPTWEDLSLELWPDRLE